ncbi:MAG TPA: sigma-70 family RNA polymerase sigma factor [Polyangiaceae bacterium]
MNAPDRPEVLARFHAEIDLVDLVARQVAARMAQAVTLDDLRSFGREGLLNAARTFDAARGVPFRRWANMRIKGAMIDGVRQWGNLPRRVYRELRALEAGDRVQEVYDEEDAAGPASTPEGADARLSSYLAGIATAIAVGTMMAAPRENVDPEGRDVTPEDLFGEAELLAHVKVIVARLPEQERTLIERHYFGGATLDEASAGLGLSKSWGSRLHARAIESIARELKKDM